MSDQEPFDASDPEDVKRRELAARIARRQAAEDLAVILRQPEGQRVFRRLLDRSGVYRTSYAGDPYRTAFNEGNRAFGVDLMRDIEVLGTDYLIGVLRSTEPKPEA